MHLLSLKLAVNIIYLFILRSEAEANCNDNLLIGFPALVYKHYLYMLKSELFIVHFEPWVNIIIIYALYPW